MELTTDNLPLKSTCGCGETEMRNIRETGSGDAAVIAEYDLHCRSCGMYLGRYIMGHWEF